MKLPKAARGLVSECIFKCCSICRVTAGTAGEESARQGRDTVHAGEVGNHRAMKMHMDVNSRDGKVLPWQQKHELPSQPQGGRVDGR